jgi:hypothetical protein
LEAAAGAVGALDRIDHTVVHESLWIGEVWERPVRRKPRVMLQGPGGQDLEYSQIATSVYQMWKQLGIKHKWRIV